MNLPQLWPESPERLLARAILVGVASSDDEPIATRVACLDAASILQDDAPDGYTVAGVEPVAGTAAQARELLETETRTALSARAVLSAAQASALLAGLQ